MGNSPFLILLQHSLMLVILVLLGPLLGAALFWKGLRIIQVGNPTYGQCAKACFAGCFSGFIFQMPMGYWGRSLDPQVLGAVQFAIFVGTQFLMVPLLLKIFSLRGWLIGWIALLLTNVVTIGLWILVQFVLPPVKIDVSRQAEVRVESGEWRVAGDERQSPVFAVGTSE